MKLTIKISGTKKFHHVFTKNSMLIGRSKACDFQINEESISRQHCLIENVNGEVFITDLNSANGVFIDSNRITPNIRVPYPLALPLSLGGFESYIEDEVEPAQSTIGLSNQESAALKNRIFVKPFHNKKVPKLDSKLGFRIVSLLGLVISIFLFVIYFNQKNHTEIAKSKFISSPTSTVGKIRFQQRANPTNFLRKREYLASFNNKSCKGPFSPLCTELSLDEKDGEGITEISGECFIFIKPSKVLINDNKTNSKVPLRQESLVGLRRLFEAKLSYQSLNIPLGHIHLVLVNKYGIISRVYQFKLKTLTFLKNDSDFIIELKNEKSLEDTNMFWKKYGEVLPGLELFGKL